MSDSEGNGRGIQIQRATIYGYFLFLVGLYFVANNVKEWVAGGSWVSALSGAVLGAFAVGAAVLMAVNPETITGGREASPMYLVILALVATALTILSIVLIFT